MKKLHLDTIFFLIVISLFGAMNLFNLNKPTVSELEKRVLTQKPEFTLSSLLDGSFFKNYENYYSDTFVFRDDLVKINRNIKRIMSGPGSGAYLVVASQDKAKQSNMGQDKAGTVNSGDVPAPAGSDNGSDSNSGKVPSATGNDLPNGSESSGGSSSGRSGTDSNGETSTGNGNSGSQVTTGGEKTQPPKKNFDEKNIGFWLIVDGKAVEIFQFDKENLEYYASVLNKYNEKLGDKVKIYSLIAPTTGDFMSLSGFGNITESQNDFITYLNSKLNKSVIPVNVYDILAKHKEEYIFYRTDHHWTALGAYYGYTAFMNARGVQPVPLDKYEFVQVKDFLGSAYSQTLDPNLEKNPDTIDIYMPFTPYKFEAYYGDKLYMDQLIDMTYADSKMDKYLIFMSTGGATWNKITTDVKNGQKVLVMKDSFGNSFVPFLLPHYEEIYVIDSRFYNKMFTGENIIEFVKNKGINEVVFLNTIGNVNNMEFMTNVEKLMDN